MSWKRGLYSWPEWIFIPYLVMLMAVGTTVVGFNLDPESAVILSDPMLGKSNSGRESYFGFSVALQQNRKSNSSWVMVGAPRANSSLPKVSKVKEPGAVFKCNLQNLGLPCEELELLTGNEWNRDYATKEDFGWLGASMDSHPEPLEDRQILAACSPLWKSEYDNHYHVNGACYWLDLLQPNARSNKILSLKDDDRQLWNKRNYDYWYGQSGFSVHLPDHQNEMLFGAPGVLNWFGSVVRVRDDSRARKFSSQIILEPLHMRDFLKDNNLFGYAVTSGKFFRKDKLLFASGAPRGSSIHGKVIIFEVSESSYSRSKANVLDWVEGTKIGEHFGASLTSADVNRDGLSDLVVGSPIYSELDKPDIGRVQVFLGTKNGLNQMPSSKHTGSKIPMARFGTTLASPGDINQDNYEDIAVGAPWENNGRGAIYIYLGSRYGLRKKFSQRLTPENIPGSSNLRGFGMSISKGTDVDNNFYPDLAIGSFLSGHAVIMKSRAVASLAGTLSSSTKNLEVEAETLNLTACIKYNGYKVPENVDIRGTLFLDSGFSPPRVSMLDDTEERKNFMITGTSGETTCKEFALRIQNIKYNPGIPISVKFMYQIEETRGKLLNTPKTNPDELRNKTLLVPILTDCVDEYNNICEVDLKVEISDHGDSPTIIIGHNKIYELEIHVTNSGESAFLPNATIKVSEPFDLYLPRSHTCSFASRDIRSELHCQLLNPIKNDTEDIVKVTIDARKVTDSSSMLTVEVSVTGDGSEVHESDNIQKKEIRLITSASLELQGFSPEEQILYPRIEEDKIDISLANASVMHHYTLVRTGPTPLENVEFSVDIPVGFPGNKSFVKLDLPQAMTYSCNLSNTQPITEISEHNIEPSLFGSTKILTCEDKEITCKTVQCNIRSWLGGTRAVNLPLKMELNFTSLAGYINASEGAIIVTHARASVVSAGQASVFRGNKKTKASVQTILAPLSVTDKRVAWWVYLVAILVGTLLLVLVAVGLYKTGFFQRKKKEELKVERERWQSQRRQTQRQSTVNK